MGHRSTSKHAGAQQLWRLSAGALLISSLYSFTGYALAAPLTINVKFVDQNGVETPITDYRWTVEEDVTKASVPGQHATHDNYSFSFHSSYMPVMAAGKVVGGTPVLGNDCGDPNSIACLDPDRQYMALPGVDPAKRYYVSVLPDDGYAMGGAPVVFDAAGNASATVYVNKYPVPTAQISIFAFEDNSPINGAPDLPQELGVEGFTVFLTEAGGTYGGSGGQVTQDAFGNPLGTEYEYDADGQAVLDGDGNPTVVTRGSGVILTNADGVAVIKNLYPAKYTIQLIPPAGSDWHQTSTIEGTKGIDAWVKNKEPSFFQEFGPPGHHVFIGFTHSGFIASNGATPVLNGTTSVTGRITSIHNSRPPNYTFYDGRPMPQCWVGLNEPAGGRALYAAPCNADSTFAIPNVPAGTWDLVVWDEPLDLIIATATITVTPAEAAAGAKALGDVPVFDWFAKYDGRVFYDANGNGFPDGGSEVGIADQVLNIRFRDGSIYQSTLTKKDGSFAFSEVFPFFNWMIAEVDYGRFKATGATITVDAGGPVPAHNGWTTPSFNKLTPQPQVCTPADVLESGCTLGNPINSPAGNNLSRTETGVILLEGMQTFLGQTNHIEWGKKLYAGQENGGIAGIVQYGITRAEDDPKNGTAETWEPGIPRVQVNLFLDCDGDNKPDKPSALGNGTCASADASSLSSLGYAYAPPDVDNYPFCWRDPASCGLTEPLMGPEDRERTGSDGVFSYGDVFAWGSDPDNGGAPYVGLGKTDGWDDALPTGCQPASAADSPPDGYYRVPYGGDAGFQLDCYDGLRNWNQVRPAVFDGGYAFGSVAGQTNLPNVKYILEAVAPPGYFHQGNGDKNVTFGDTLVPAPLAEPYACVGMDLPVPQYLTLFPALQDPNPMYNPANPAATWKKCDMKAVDMQPGRNAAPNFFLYTEAPVAGHGVGFILDDMSSEFDVNAPTFGEKHAPPHLPVSISDWTGSEVSRVYADEFGSYNFLVPSSFTINPPFPSGVQPSMMVSCMNSPGPIPDPSGATNPDGSPIMVIDPYFNRQYSQFCYTLQYLPGKTTYLDTPVVPVAAFAGRSQNPLDCELGDGTPMIYSVTGPLASGPYLPSGGGALTIVSAGLTEVPNPYYDPAAPGSTKTIQRDNGFGSAGSVTLNGVPLTVVGAWNNDILQVTVPAGASTGELLVTRGSGATAVTSPVGITVTKGGTAHYVPAGGSIQAVIDDPLTHDGDLVIVPPGIYNEYVIMDKRIKLQGWGALSTTINAARIGTASLNDWRKLINRKSDPAQATFDLLPGQTLGVNLPNNEPLLFGAEEGPGVLVVGRASPSGPGNGHFTTDRARIDGITITGGDFGGGILASGYARFLEVSNNRIVSNYGTYGGGIRIGHTALTDAANTLFGGYTDSQNGCLPNQSCTTGVTIHNNWIAENGASEAGGGGGITIGNGANNYQIANNYVCGNYSMADGGGISHLGRSDGGKIINNKILFNQTFNQSLNATGGGLFVGGLASLDASGLSPGTGDVTVDSNLIQGNNAGAGAGGGVRLAQINGLDISTANNPNNNNTWNQVTLVNNMIVDNVAGYAGGGVSLVDALKVNASNNTIANNDSTATNVQSFANAGDTTSSPQPAGMVSHATSTAIRSLLNTNTSNNNRFSNPTLNNNIVWHNRSFCWAVTGTGAGDFGLFDANTNGTCNTGSPAGSSPVYVDLAVLGTANQGTFAGRYVGAGVDKLNPTYSILSEGTNVSTSAGYGPNSGGSNKHNQAVSDPLFVSAYLNGNRKPAPIIPGTTTLIDTAATADEGGNFIDVRYGPLTPWNCLALGGSNGQPTTQSGCPLYADYHINTGSPAIDAGLSRTGSNGVPTLDFDGGARPATAIDIGADELSPPSADLAITKTDGNTSVSRGSSVQYTIVVTNNGPNPVTGAVVTDTRPTALPSWSWSCSPTVANGCGTTGNSGTGNINKTLGTLAVGASVTITATGTVSSSATSLSNTATVTAPSTVDDLNTANNSATDTDSILLGAASFNPNPVAFGNIATNTTATQTVTVTNTGAVPLAITSAMVTGPRFGKGTDTCSGQTIPVNGTCSVNVTFNPNNNNPRNGVLTVVHNGLNSPQSIALSGQ